MGEIPVYTGTPKELYSQVKEATLNIIFASLSDYGRTHLWRDHNGAEGASI